jgi:hypothetical protein
MNSTTGQIQLAILGQGLISTYSSALSEPVILTGDTPNIFDKNKTGLILFKILLHNGTSHILM